MFSLLSDLLRWFGQGLLTTAVNIFGTARNRWKNRDFFGSDGYTTNSFGDSMPGQLPEKVRENQPKPPSSKAIASTEDVHRSGRETLPEPACTRPTFHRTWTGVR